MNRICLQHLGISPHCHNQNQFMNLYISLLKGTHARDFHSLFLNFFLHLSVTNRYKTQYSQHFRKYSSNSPRYSKFSITHRFSLKARSMAEHCRQKHGVKLSVVFVTVRFGLFWAFSAKKQSQNLCFWRKRGVKPNRCWRKCGVKLCAFGNIQRIQRRSEIMRFRRIRRVKRSVFAEKAEWNGAFSVKTRYSRKSGYVLGFNTYLNKIFEILGLCLIYYWMMPKNCEKRTIKSRACVPLRSLYANKIMW